MAIVGPGLLRTVAVTIEVACLFGSAAKLRLVGAPARPKDERVYSLPTLFRASVAIRDDPMPRRVTWGLAVCPVVL